MTSRQWRDPRNMRRWEVTVTGLATPTPGSLRRRRRNAVCFEGSGTPRQGLHVECCERAEAVFPELADQDLALCLEAARHGGLLWVDPRDGELWWIHDVPGEGNATIELRSSSRTVLAVARPDQGAADLADADIVDLLASALIA